VLDASLAEAEEEDVATPIEIPTTPITITIPTAIFL